MKLISKSLQEHIENMDDPLDTNRQKWLREAR